LFSTIYPTRQSRPTRPHATGTQRSFCPASPRRPSRGVRLGPNSVSTPQKATGAARRRSESPPTVGGRWFSNGPDGSATFRRSLTQHRRTPYARLPAVYRAALE